MLALLLSRKAQWAGGLCFLERLTTQCFVLYTLYVRGLILALDPKKGVSVGGRHPAALYHAVLKTTSFSSPCREAGT